VKVLHCTFSVIEATRDEALDLIKTRITEYANKGLYPDTPLKLHEAGARTVDIYEVRLRALRVSSNIQYQGVELTLMATKALAELKDTHALEAATKKGEWIATIHLSE